MAAGGMGGPQDRTRAPLAERGRRIAQQQNSGAQQPPEPPEQPEQPPDEGRPCWVLLGDHRQPGTVHGWHRDEATGQWLALVVAWLPSTAVERRNLDGR
jgi:hypothetical protein